MACAVVVGGWTLAGPAIAQPPPRPADEPRPMPEYDGRVDEPPEEGDVLLWIPRIALAPLYLVTEHVIRRPLGAILTALERETLQAIVADVLTWEQRSAGVIPTARFDLGQLPSAGLYFFWNDRDAEGHELRAAVSFGGTDWLRAAIWDRALLSRRGDVELTLRAEGRSRPDHVFQGFGPLSAQSDRARFRGTRLDGSVGVTLRPWRRSELSLVGEVSHHDFSGDGYALLSDEPSLNEALERGVLATPPGFDGYTAYRQRLRGALDSRRRAPEPVHGVRLDVLAEQALDLARPLSRRWLRYGGGLAGFVDLGGERVISLHVRAELVERLGVEPIPFTDRVRLGGPVLRLAGFLEEQLIGDSGVVASLRYRYAVWTWLDASLFLSVGNVFGERFAGFSFDRLRLSGGLDVVSVGDRDHRLQVTIALGTAPFAVGSGVESVRLQIGGWAGVR